MLILNRDFKMPADGWYQIAPLGEFPHAAAEVIQVIDDEACIAMAARLAADAAVAHFAGLLIDFDHFSLQGGQRSEAAGWIVGLEWRAHKTDGSDETDKGRAGLWAQIRWSDLGEEAVKGGRYRFLSPVWAREDCVDLGPVPAGAGISDGMRRVRPVRLLNAAVTNDPNLKGIVPLSNASTSLSAGTSTVLSAASGQTKDGRGVEKLPYGRGTAGACKGVNMKAVIEKLLNHLGLAADSVEAVILEKMAGLPALTAVTELQNSLTAARTELDVLKVTLKAVEGELVNRHLAEFEGVVTEKTKGFWTEQLLANRAGALTALNDLAALGDEGKDVTAGGKREEAPPTRKPLHNRATARAVPPGQAGGGAGPGSGPADSRAVKIRNRAHEIAAAEKIPFGVAFRRAERETAG